MHRRTTPQSAILAILFACLVIFPGRAQKSGLSYPQARKGDVVDDYFGTKVADPYRWMEDLNSSELKKWIDEENAVTFKYLERLPARAELKARISQLWDYPKQRSSASVGGIHT
jgi:prolyl oligopeptidase